MSERLQAQIERALGVGLSAIAALIAVTCGSRGTLEHEPSVPLALSAAGRGAGTGSARDRGVGAGAGSGSLWIDQARTREGPRPRLEWVGFFGISRAGGRDSAGDGEDFLVGGFAHCGGLFDRGFARAGSRSDLAWEGLDLSV